MYVHNQRREDSTAQQLRRAGGTWLKRLRTNANLSQRELAERVGAEYYTFISQLENGRGRIPPDRYAEWAKALGVPTHQFVFNVMRFYDPVTFGLLFGEDAEYAQAGKRFELIG